MMVILLLKVEIFNKNTKIKLIIERRQIKNMKTYHFQGQLSISDTNSINNKINYIITSPSDNSQTSLTNILDNIFNGKNINNKLVRVLGRVNNIEFNGMGCLHMCRSNEQKVEGYCVGSMQLESKLFENVGNQIEILLEDYTDFVFSEVRVKNENAKSIVL